MKQHAEEFRLISMCRVLRVHRSGYYAWLRQPQSRRAVDDTRLLGLIKHAWLESGGIYGHRKIHDDLRKDGERCSKHRVARLMRLEGLRAQVGYRRRRYIAGGKPAHVAPNALQQQFSAAAPNERWVTDITYLPTYEGFLYLAVVIDLFSRQVVGWSMQSRIHSDLVLQALLMAVWRRKPKPGLILHSDQGSQYTGHAWQNFLGAHGIVCSMSRRGNCHDNAVAESFFQLLKRERVRRKTYATHADARADVFDYIEMFFNPKRSHGNNGGLSPVEFEQRYLNQGS